MSEKPCDVCQIWDCPGKKNCRDYKVWLAEELTDFFDRVNPNE